MRRAVTALSLCLAAALVAAGCGSSDSSSPSCGASGGACCEGSVCNTGLTCNAGTCEPDPAACGRLGAACCATAPACANGVVCHAGVCGGGSTEPDTTVTRSVCGTGATLEIAGATLTIPAGALTACRQITFSRSVLSPGGYTLYSPVIEVSPATLTFATPATVSIDYVASSQSAALFWSRSDTTGYLPVNGVDGGTALSGPSAGAGRASSPTCSTCRRSRTGAAWSASCCRAARRPGPPPWPSSSPSTTAGAAR
ncbi:MAG: hypothetical protein QM767_07350 [Anaeromyxobacter sp.]